MNKSMHTFYFVPPEEEHDQLYLYALEGILPPCQALAVGISTRIVSLVSTAPDAVMPIVGQRVLTEPELRMLLPLLECPGFCSCEFLSASRICGFEVLLAGLYAPLPRHTAWQEAIEEQQRLLERAREERRWKKAFRDVYYALSDLRGKLHAFGLEVSSVRAGYALTRYGPKLSAQPCSCRQRLILRHTVGR